MDHCITECAHLRSSLRRWETVTGILEKNWRVDMPTLREVENVLEIVKGAAGFAVPFCISF